MPALPHALPAIVAIASIPAAIAADPVAIETKLSVFDASNPIAAQLKALGEPYQTALKNADAPIQQFLAAYATILQQGLDKAKASGDFGRAKIHETALANWKLGKLPPGNTGLTGEMQFVMKTPKIYAQSRQLYTAIIKRLTQEDKAGLARALEARVQEIGMDFGVLPGSPLFTGDLLDYIFTVDGDFAHRLGSAYAEEGRVATIKDRLTNRGVTFPAGANAVVNPKGQLIVTNTRENLYIIQKIIDSL